jgi:hypothetical protein
VQKLLHHHTELNHELLFEIDVVALVLQAGIAACCATPQHLQVGLSLGVVTEALF